MNRSRPFDFIKKVFVPIPLMSTSRNTGVFINESIGVFYFRDYSMHHLEGKSCRVEHEKKNTCF